MGHQSNAWTLPRNQTNIFRWNPIRSGSALTGTTPQVQNSAWVDKDVSLAPSCTIGQGARLFGQVTVGEKVRIESNVVVYGPTKVGPGSFIGPNVVLGSPSRTELTDSVSQGRNIHDVPGRRQLVIGRNCVVRSGTCIYSDVSIGDDVSFGHNVMVRENVRIGKNTLVGTGVVIDGWCQIGERVSIQTGVYICTNCTIEDSVFLGPCAVFTNDKYVGQKRTDLVGPTVRRGASIGANSLLMPSIEIGEGSVIGAQSLVTHDVPPRSIYVGIPARKLKSVPADWRTYLLPQ
jgi:acetyltransferase-like isoleucine patch superfamily enzyme